MITCEKLKLDVILDSPQIYRNLTIYPLLRRVDVDLDYLTLDEAMKENGITIKEVGSGSVPELLLINELERDVLIISGEELLGAKQNRTVNVSILVAAKHSLNIPVSCTERGRWREGKDGLKMRAVNAQCSLPRVRRVLTSSVFESLKAKGSYDSDQREVWKSIDDTMVNLGVSSFTSAQSDIFKEEVDSIEDYLKYFYLVPDQAGMLALINGQFISLDFLGKRDTFTKMYEKMLRSCVVDAISENGKSKIRNEKIEEYLEDLRTANIETHKAPGKGDHLLIRGRMQKGMALVSDGNLIHVSSFPL
jgi:hypothetical protein